MFRGSLRKSSPVEDPEDDRWEIGLLIKVQCDQVESTLEKAFLIGRDDIGKLLGFGFTKEITFIRDSAQWSMAIWTIDHKELVVRGVAF